MTNSNNNNVTSKLLVWPRNRRRQGEESGFVLGWVTTSSSSSPTEESRQHHQQQHRQSVVCAGILPPTQTLEEYEQRLEALRDAISESKPEICSCLIDSLQIVAYFVAKSKDQTADSSLQTKLPVLSLQRGYPWWQEETFSESDKNNTQHRQVLYYNNYEDHDSKKKSRDLYAHWSSEYSDIAGSDWKLLLHRLGHAREIFDMIVARNASKIIIEESAKKSTIPTEPKAKQETASNHGGREEETENPSPDDASSSWWNRILHLMSRQSLTYLHLQQRFRQTDSILSMIPLFQCLNLSRKTSVHAAAVYECSICDKPTFLANKPRSAKRLVGKWDQLLAALLDASWGISAALLLWVALRYVHVFGPTLYQFKQAFVDILKRQISWLEAFPAGFKLNVKLTTNMGYELRNLMDLHEKWMEASFWNGQVWQEWLGPGLIVVAALGGWTSFLAVMMDMARLEFFHITLLVVWFRNVYKAELYLLAAFGRLFRGKKRNVLRRRTDSMRYDAMQLLVGTIGFSICIFLWTTIMVYYTFFVVWNILLHLPILCLWIAYVLSRSIPLGSLLWRLGRRDWFAENVYIQTQQDNEVMHTAWLFSVSTSPLRILLCAFVKHLAPLLRWLVGFCLEILIPRSSNQSPCTLPLATLLEEFEGATIR